MSETSGAAAPESSETPTASSVSSKSESSKPASPTLASPTSAPVAKKVPLERTHHGHTFVDDFEWMREKDSPEVIAHLEAENAWTAAQTAHLEGLQESIFTEIKTRIKETDMSVPNRRGAYWYFSRTRAGLDYGISVRVPISGPEDWTPPTVGEDELPGEEVVFDSNLAAEGQEFFSLGSFSLSDDGRWLLFGVDTTGDERYTLRLRDLETGDELDDVIEGTFAGASLDPSGRFVFYTTVDDAWRPEKVWRHRVGTAAGADTCIFEEPDERYFVGSGFSRSGTMMFVVTGSKTTTGYWSISADDLEAEPQEVWPRVEGVEYHVEHAVIGGEDRFLITHNRNRDDFELVDVPASDPTADPRPVLADIDGMRIEDVDAFADFIVLSYRRGGFARVGTIALTLDAASPYGALQELPFGRDRDPMLWPTPSSPRPPSGCSSPPCRLRLCSTPTASRTALTRFSNGSPCSAPSNSRQVLRRDPAVGSRRGRHRGADLGGLPHGPAALRRSGHGRLGAGRAVTARPLRVRLLRSEHGPVFLGLTAVSARPRGRLRHRPRPRRRRDGPTLVRPGQDHREEEHLHGLHRRREPPRRGGMDTTGPARGRRRIGRRTAHGRGREHGSRTLRRNQCARALRRRSDLDPHARTAADRHRMGGMGRSAAR